jgi:hypothetical protein
MQSSPSITLRHLFIHSDNILVGVLLLEPLWRLPDKGRTQVHNQQTVREPSEWPGPARTYTGTFRPCVQKSVH